MRRFALPISEMARPLVLVSLALAGCLEFSPHDLPDDASERDINARSVAALSRRAPHVPLRFAVLGDAQRLFDDARDAVAALNGRDDLDFVVQLGDLTDLGLTFEFEEMNRVLADLRVPYLVVVGNHDLLGNGRWIYERMLGPLDFAFTYGGTRFVLLNTNSLELPSAPDLSWLADRLAPDPSHERAVVLAHTPPDADEFDPDARESYYALLAAAAVKLSLHGHLHRYEVRAVDGMALVIADVLSNRNFVVVTAAATGDGFELERVFF